MTFNFSFILEYILEHVSAVFKQRYTFGLVYIPTCTLHSLENTIVHCSRLRNTPSRGYREALDGRLCRPDSEGRPLSSNLTTVAIVKLCCHNFTQIANFVIFFVSSISYRPTDLSLLKEFSKNVTF